MAKELIIGDSLYAKSYALLPEYSLDTWLKAQPNDKTVWDRLLRGKAGAMTGTQLVTLMSANLRTLISSYLVGYGTNAIGIQVNPTTVSNLMIGNPVPHTAISTLQNCSVKQAQDKLDSAQQKSRICSEATASADTLRKALVGHWLYHTLALQHPLPNVQQVNDLNVRTSANVACAVHGFDGASWAQIGTMKTAVPKATGPNHAEMQWWDSHGTTLAGQLANLQRVDFHISEQPCGQYCAERMMEKWAALNSQVAAYVITYKDTDNRENVYRLLPNAILRLT